MQDIYCFQNVFVIVDKPPCAETVILFNFLLFQGEMLTVVEYFLLLYRALLPTPVWYCFFLNKEYGSLFSSLTTGLYLTFKLTSVVEKVPTLPSHQSSSSLSSSSCSSQSCHGCNYFLYNIHIFLLYNRCNHF